MKSPAENKVLDPKDKKDAVVKAGYVQIPGVSPANGLAWVMPGNSRFYTLNQAYSLSTLEPVKEKPEEKPKKIK